MLLILKLANLSLIRQTESTFLPFAPDCLFFQAVAETFYRKISLLLFQAPLFGLDLSLDIGTKLGCNGQSLINAGVTVNIGN